MTQQNQFFSGLKVVEFASVLAGPAVGMFFAELGADVVKIENKTTGGDMTRGWKMENEDPEWSISAYFCSVNWGKKHLFLDLNDPADAQNALELALAADVVISNFKPSAARRWGLDANNLRAQNPRLIIAQLNAFSDPEDESPAFDVVLQAEAGFMHMNGEAEGPPVKMPVAFIDLLAAHQLKEGILLALLHRERSGQGAVVSTSLFESAIASLANQASNYLMNGNVPQRMGTQHPNIAPYGDVFMACDNRPVLLAVGTERQFRQLCAALDLPELAEHPDFQNNTARIRNRTALISILAEKISADTADAWLTRFKKFGVPAAQIRDLRSVLNFAVSGDMILKEYTPNPRDPITRRIKTVAFHLSTD